MPKSPRWTAADAESALIRTGGWRRQLFCVNGQSVGQLLVGASRWRRSGGGEPDAARGCRFRGASAHRQTAICGRSPFFTAGRRNSCNRLAGIAVQVTVGRMMALRKHQEWREGSDPLTARQPGPRKPRCQGQPGNGNDVASGGNPRATPFSSDFVPEGQHPWAENVLPPHPHPFSPRSASLAWVRWNPPSSPHSSTPTRCC